MRFTKNPKPRAGQTQGSGNDQLGGKISPENNRPLRISQPATYHAEIRAIDHRGTHEAVLRNHGIAVRSPDPEHDLCFAMVMAGLRDGAIQFCRGATPTLRFRSVHRAARCRAELGDRFPYRLVRRKVGAPSGRPNSRRQARQDGHFEPELLQGFAAQAARDNGA